MKIKVFGKQGSKHHERWLITQTISEMAVVHTFSDKTDDDKQMAIAVRR